MLLTLSSHDGVAANLCVLIYMYTFSFPPKYSCIVEESFEGYKFLFQLFKVYNKRGKSPIDMTSRGLRRSRSRSADSGKSGSHKSHDRPWLRNNRSNSRSRSRSTSRSRSSRGRRTSKDGSRSSSPTRPVMSKDPKYVNARVFVANLASDITTTGELTKLFEKHGRILGLY